MIDFAAIPIFVTVIETGSFSKAAEQLGSSKSAVSKRITQLETRLGVRLINRTTRKLSLTSAGEQYLAYATQAYDAAKQGEDLVTQQQSKPKGVVKFGVPMTFGRLHIAPLLAQFQKQYPDIQLEMQLDDRVVDLVETGLDFVIRIGELKDSSLIAKPIAQCHSIICASPAYLSKAGIPSSPQCLTEHNCLLYSYYQAGNDWYFSPGYNDDETSFIKVTPRGSFTANNSEAIHQAVLDGVGIAQLPTFIVANDVRAKRLVPLLSAYPLPEHGIYALLPERKHVPTKVSLLIEYLSQAIAQRQRGWKLT